MNDQLPTSTTSACVLVTGATGFLGKVVVEQLLRRRQKLGVSQVICLVRPKRGVSPQVRFTEHMVTSPCFSRLADGWQRRVSIVTGELAKTRCGLSHADYHRVTQQVTHIIHCAASVDFARPVKEACTANVLSSLHVLDLAQQCRSLRCMVSTSTAYVSTHRLGPIEEVLEPLPRPAAALFDDIIQARVPEAKLLAETGHPNTYTYTKCIAEHLLCERRGQVPLCIVRPSIISASWRYPMPGWIDSKAAFAGFVATIGAGYLRLLDADPETLLDLVPVDFVAQCLIDQSMQQPGAKSISKLSKDHLCDPAGVPIVYAVSGRDRADSIGNTWRAIVRFYRRNPAGRRARIYYVGAKTQRYAATEFIHQRIPAALTRAYLTLRGDARGRRRAQRLAATLRSINDIFPYFTHHTFDFRTSTPLPASFDTKTYVNLVCQGVYTHLMHRDASQVPIGGSHLKTRHPDFLWGLNRVHGNITTRATAVLGRKILRRAFDEITFDRQSFDAATRQTGSQAQYLIVPTHRSYLDFLVCAYLFVARPDLGIVSLHMAAEPRLFDVPLLGGWLRRVRTFARMQAHDEANAPTLQAIHRLVRTGKNLLFFVEGERSRSRQFMPPQLGMLQALKDAHRPIVVLPVAISYDRIAEESPFLREMKGASRTSLTVPHLVAWARRMVGHKIHLGRVHVRCGAPQTLNEHTDVPALGRRIVAELQRNTVVSTFHLQCFVALHPQTGVDVQWLRRAIEQRGGTVVHSPLVSATAAVQRYVLDPSLERSMRYHWQHHFFAEAKALAPENVALAHYIAANDFMTSPECALAPATESFAVNLCAVDVDARLQNMLRVLFEPICADYVAVAKAAQALPRASSAIDTHALLQQANCIDYPTAQLGLQALVAGRLLIKATVGAGTLQRPDPSTGPQQAWGAYLSRCVWPTPLSQAE